MFKLKSCPKCRGDLIIEQVHRDQCEYCLQCGYRRDFRIDAHKTKNNMFTSISKHLIS